MLQASQLLKSGNLNSTELVQACLKRIKDTKHCNAFIKVLENESIQQSIQSTERYRRSKQLSGIDGIPLVIKDNFCTANINTTCASKMLQNFVPSYDSTVYKKLMNAGGILLAKSNLDQFAMGSGTVDSIYGPTKNIWGYEENKDFYIAGGSSGGSAVAVASGSCFA